MDGRCDLPYYQNNQSAARHRNSDLAHHHECRMTLGLELYILLSYSSSPMNYLRNLVPHMATSQPSSRPQPISRHSECSDDGHLLPLPRQDDDTELPPFVPSSDDRTSLSQVESSKPNLNLDRLPRPRLYRPSSDKSSPSSAFYDPLERGSRSDPATPAPTSSRRNQSLRRRNSTPASKRIKPTVTFHPNSPLSTPQSEYATFVNDEDNEEIANETMEEDIAPDSLSNCEGSRVTMADRIAADSRRPSSTSAVINQWLDSAEGSRSPCAEHIDQLPTRVQTLPPDADPMPGCGTVANVSDPFGVPLEPMSLDDFEGAQGTHRPAPLERAETEPSLSVPHEIRLRRASRQKQLDLRRRSMPHLADRSSSVVPPGDHSSPPYSVSLKSTIAEPVLTHAWTNRTAPQDMIEERSAITTTRASGSTLQVVQSRDSVYEVIWEDSKVCSTTPNHAVKTPARTFADYNATRLPDEPILGDTTMAAWYWKGSTHDSAPSLHTVNMPPSQKITQPITIAGRTMQGKHWYFNGGQDDGEVALTAPISARPHVTEMRRQSSTESRPHTRTIPSMSSVIDAGNRSAGLTEYVAPSAISARQRRELLGNRKYSNNNNSPEEEHFTGHRDSLVLAHNRIFHDHEKHGFIAHGEEAPDPRIGQLKRETWHVKRPKSPSQPDSSSSFGSNEEVVDHSHKVPVPVSILVQHGLQQRERPQAVKSASGKHIKLAVEDDVMDGD